MSSRSCREAWSHRASAIPRPGAAHRRGLSAPDDKSRAKGRSVAWVSLLRRTARHHSAVPAAGQHLVGDVRFRSLSRPFSHRARTMSQSPFGIHRRGILRKAPGFVGNSQQPSLVGALMLSYATQYDLGVLVCGPTMAWFQPCPRPHAARGTIACRSLDEFPLWRVRAGKASIARLSYRPCSGRAQVWRKT